MGFRYLRRNAYYTVVVYTLHKQPRYSRDVIAFFMFFVSATQSILLFLCSNSDSDR